MSKKEAVARLKINKLLEESGWRLIDSEAGRANVDVETRLSPGEKIDLHEAGEDYENVKGGFIDYLLLDGTDVVVGAVSPRGDMAGKVAPLYRERAKKAANYHARLIIIGGFSGLRSSKDAPRFFEDGGIPEEYKNEALELASVFDALKNDAPAELDWLFISPAAVFGAYANVADTGAYRMSDDAALYDQKGESRLSGADFALGVVDEIEANQHHRENISFAQ